MEYKIKEEDAKDVKEIILAVIYFGLFGKLLMLLFS